MALKTYIQDDVTLTLYNIINLGIIFFTKYVIYIHEETGSPNMKSAMGKCIRTTNIFTFWKQQMNDITVNQINIVCFIINQSHSNIH